MKSLKIKGLKPQGGSPIRQTKPKFIAPTGNRPIPKKRSYFERVKNRPKALIVPALVIGTVGFGYYKGGAKGALIGIAVVGGVAFVGLNLLFRKW